MPLDTSGIVAALQKDPTLDEVILEFLAEWRSSRAVHRASRALSWLEVVFPKRVLNEEIGDALEVISRIARDPRSSHRAVKIALKVVTTTFWVVVNSVRVISSSLFGKKVE